MRSASTRLPHCGSRRNSGLSATALTYWLGEADGIHVVTTIDRRVNAAAADETAPGPERHAVARFAAPILPGQSQVISVQGPAGAPQQALRTRRFANRLGVVVVEVERVSVPSAGGTSRPSGVVRLSALIGPWQLGLHNDVSQSPHHRSRPREGADAHDLS